MRLYAGSDLHSSNTYLGIKDEDGKRVFKKKLPNDREIILGVITENIGHHFQDEIHSFLIERRRELVVGVIAIENRCAINSGRSFQ